MVTLIILLALGLIVWLNFHPHWRPEILDARFKADLASGTSPGVRRRIEGCREAPEQYPGIADIAAGASGTGVTSGNKVEVITDGARKYTLLMHDLDAARETIHMEYFLFGFDKGSRDVVNMLVKKAAEGVKVRFVSDNLMNFPTYYRYRHILKKGGVEVLRFTKPWDLLHRSNFRNHRKIVVIDSRVAYTGGMNISDRYFLRWRDTHLRIEGGAVAQLQYLFLNSWHTSGGRLPKDWDPFFPLPDEALGAAPSSCRVQIVADEPGLSPHPVEECFMEALEHSKKYFFLQSPYFVPTKRLLDRIKEAARSGLDVRVMLPAKPEKITAFMKPLHESYYRECLLAGIRFFEKGGEFIHSKTFVADDTLSCIGSSNFDCRSLLMAYEANALIYDRQTALLNRQIFLADQQDCTEVTLSQLESVPWRDRLLQRVLRLFASVL